MFTITDEPTFRHNIKVSVPTDGGHTEQTMGVTYRVISDEETDAHDLRLKKDSVAWLKRIIVELHDLVDVAKKPVPYSDAVRDQVLNLPYARLAIARGYFEAVTGAREGN